MIINENKKVYNLHIVINSQEKKILSSFIKQYLQQTNLLIGLDFEFKNRKIALLQMNLECDNLEPKLFIIYPPDLNKKEKDISKRSSENADFKNKLFFDDL